MGSIRRMIGFLKPYWKIAILAPLAMILEVVMDLAQPNLLGKIVDVGIAQLDMGVVLGTGALMIGLAIVGVAGGVGATIIAVKVTQRLGADLRSKLFRKVQSFSFSNLDELQTGSLVTRLTNDVTQVQDTTQMMLRIMVRVPFMLIGALIMAIITSPQLALLFLVLGPIVLAMATWVVIKAQPLFMAMQKRLDRLNTVMQETLSGVRVIKAFVRATYEKERFGIANASLRDQTIKAARVVAVVMPFMMLTINLGVVGVIWFGGVQVIQGSMHLGQILAFINYLMIALREVLMVAMLLMRISRAEASAERIAEVLDTEPTIEDRPDAITDLVSDGRVVFDHVSLNYDGAESDPALRDISFVAEPGQTVAILGSTGSGKSTLVNLIPRFYDVTGGKVTLSGVDVRDLSQQALRENIAVALQDAVLFTGTIRDNIRYGRPSATDEEVEQAAKAAQAHEFVMSFPEGYDTLLGQRGVNLSGGQKQRLTIARALLMSPKVLILDDSTSAVDVETEARIQEELEKLMKGRTSFVIAQRISTVLTADKILVLDDGMLVAEGTHQTLLADSPIYREIYESQLGNGVAANG